MNSCMSRVTGDESDSAHAVFPPATPTLCSHVIRVSRVSSNEETSGKAVRQKGELESGAGGGIRISFKVSTERIKLHNGICCF